MARRGRVVLVDSHDSARFERPVRIPVQVRQSLPRGDSEEALLARLEAYHEAAMANVPPRWAAVCAAPSE